MKISILDTIFPIGHLNLNKKLISLFPVQDYDLWVINNGHFFKENDINNSTLIDINFLKDHKKYIITVLFQVINYLKIWIKLFGRKDKIKFFFTFDNVAFAFGRFFFLNSKNVLFHHANTDYLSIGYIRFFFKTYMNSVYHIVFADFIKDRLIQIGVEEARIKVLTHPLHITNIITPEITPENIILGLGYASDDLLFTNIIDFEKKTEILNRKNIKLLLRSNNIEFKSQNITFIKGHLSEQEYEILLSKASIILILYSNNYQYRYSGAILDALRHKKLIIGVNIPIMNHFKNLYPKTCFIFDNIEDLFSKLVTISNIDFNNSDYNIFMSNHSDMKIRNEIENIIISL